jgi:uncharacterized ferredoxin-like protein
MFFNHNYTSGWYVLNEEDTIKNALLRVAELMVLSAKTAPKARGMDNIVAKIVIGEEKRVLAEK